jgi:hypothetical protein
MPIFKAQQVANRVPVPSANAATDVIPIVGDFLIPAGLVTGDIFELAPLPAGYVVVDIDVDHAILGSAFTGAIGLMSGNYLDGGARTCGAQFIAAATYQAAAIKRIDVAGGMRIAPTTNDRSIGLVISGTLTSPVVGAALRITVLARPASEGV